MNFRYFIVEDAFFIQEVLQGILDAKGGYCVGNSADGEEAVEKIKQVIPDVVFLDLVLPKKNGVEIIQEIKEYNPGVRIVVVSALDFSVLNSEDIKKDIDYLIKKPFSKKEIEEVIINLFKKMEVA